MGHLKLDSRRRKRVKYCPCSKNNKDGKFVPYVGHEKFGYCHSCGKGFFPEQGTIIDTNALYKELPTFYYDKWLIADTGKDFKNNNFVQYLKNKFGEEATKKAILDYLIGTSKHWEGATIFWQIDNHENLRYGKIMLYDSDTGKRSKHHFNNVQSVMAIDNAGFKTRQCLFGLHLIIKMKNNRVAVVESEKTAIIMSIIFPQFTWLATGGKGNFKYDLLKPLKSFDILAFPDKDATQVWQDTADKLNKYGYNIKIDKTLDRMNVDDNSDLADIFLGETREYTDAEIKVKKMAEINPALIQLIDEFDLVDANGNDILL